MKNKISRLVSARIRLKRPLSAAPAGFTLTEVLVAMLVLAVGCMAVINMQSSGMNAGHRAAKLAVATFLAESQAEWIQTTALNEVQYVSSEPQRLAEDGSVCPDTAPDSQCYTRTTTTACFAPTTRSCEVAIKIEWVSADGDGALYYETVVSDYGF